MKKILARTAMYSIAIVILYHIMDSYFITPVKENGIDGFIVGIIGLIVTVLFCLILYPIIKWIIKNS